MAKNTKKLRLSAGGEQYDLTIPEKIYDELGISEQRFAELLARDFYCPTVSAKPDSLTITYTDVDGSVNHFQIGQSCRWLFNGEYRISIMIDTDGSNAVWYNVPEENISWEGITGKPTTLSGYGITDALPESNKGVGVVDGCCYGIDDGTLGFSLPSANGGGFITLGLDDKCFFQLFGGIGEQNLSYRKRFYGEDSVSDWVTVLDSNNFKSYLADGIEPPTARAMALLSTTTCTTWLRTRTMF